MDLREQFVLRAKAPGANVSELAREYGISRKTGYKWLARFAERGVGGLRDMSRRPKRVVSTSGEVVLKILELRHEHPSWGPKKLRVLLRSEGVEAPSVKTIARILLRAGEPRLRRRRVTQKPSPPDVFELPAINGPNDLWTVDFKGWWRTKDGRRAEPLTVRDAYSRKVLLAKLMRRTTEEYVRQEFERLFEKNGLPLSIQSDNGPPFASVKALRRLTKLSAWWVSLGIKVHRGRPAHPQDNGAHERMHADMQVDLESKATNDLEAQQRACDGWVEEFNNVRPHEALEMKTPSAVYRPSRRRYRGPRVHHYPQATEVRRVTRSGHIKLNGAKLFVSEALANQDIGLEQLETGEYRMWFYEMDLGTIRTTFIPQTGAVTVKSA